MITQNLKFALKSAFSRGAVGANSLLTFVSLVMQFATGAALMIVLSRLLDVATLGEIMYATIFGNISAVMASYGFENLVIREVSQKRYTIPSITASLLVAKLILSAVLVLGTIVFINIVPIPLKRPADLWFYLVAALVNSFSTSLSALRKGKNDFATDTRVSLFSNSLLFAVTLGAALRWTPTTALIGQMRLLTRLAAFAFALVISVKASRREEPALHWQGPQIPVAWQLLVVGFPFGMQALLGTAYFQTDVLVLGALRDAREVGYYQAAMQLVSAAMLVAVAISHAYYPRLAEAYSASTARGQKLMRQMIGILAALGLGFTAFFAIGAPAIITLVYGAKMAPSIQAMRILSFLFLVRSVAGGLGVSLMSIGLQRVTAVGGGIALVVSMALNVMLIPRGGFAATAWVNLLTNVCVLGIYLGVWVKRWRTLPESSQ